MTSDVGHGVGGWWVMSDVGHGVGGVEHFPSTCIS